MFLSVFFSSCVGWLDDDHTYERKLNSWASVIYFSTNQGFSDKEIDICPPAYDGEGEQERIAIDYNYKTESPIIRNCTNIMYNNDYILAQNKNYVNDSSYSLIDRYYKITPLGINEIDSYAIDTISKADFDVLVADCKDCQELDADKIRQLDYELDHGGFPTKTFLFILLVVAYVFYRIRKRKITE